MKIRIQLKVLLIITLFVGTTSMISSNKSTYSVSVTVKKLRNAKGSVQIQVYKDQTSFADEKPWKTYTFSKKSVSGGQLSFKISDLPKGTYGFTLLDDENNNKEMDYGLLMPKEGFGFSDYYHTAWSRPVFNDFKFDLSADKKVYMSVRYV